MSAGSVCALALSLMMPASLNAQVVRGEVFDSLANRPLGSVMISLLDSAGGEHGRVVSDALGQFVLRADAPGEYVLRTRLVGYRGWRSAEFDLVHGQTIVRRISLMLVPITLPGLTVEADRTCVVRPAEGLAAAALWGEIKKALELTQLTIDRRRYRFRTELTTQTVDQYRNQVSADSQPAVGYSIWGFGSASARELQEFGYVRRAEGGPIYYGPDADVLVSDVFLDHHCFRVMRGDREGLVGLAFEPVSRGNHPDVKGTLWVDSATVALRSLEWSYTELSRWARVGRPGGAMQFSQLPNGAWFIKRWELRAPVGRVVVGRSDTMYSGSVTREGRVTEVLTAAGALVALFDSAGTIRDTVPR